MAVGDGTWHAIDFYYSAITGIWGTGTLPSILQELYVTVEHNIKAISSANTAYITWTEYMRSSLNKILKVSGDLSLLAESFVGRLSNNCTSLWVFWTSTCHRSRCANWYIVLIESDSTLSQHPSGHLATVAPGTVALSRPAEVGPGPRLCRRMQLTHKTRPGERLEGDTEYSTSDSWEKYSCWLVHRPPLTKKQPISSKLPLIWNWKHKWKQE